MLITLPTITTAYCVFETPVLGLAGMELISPTAAHIQVQCSAPVGRTALVSNHKQPWYCTSVLSIAVLCCALQHQDSLQPPKPAGWGWARGGEGTYQGSSPKPTKGICHTKWCHTAIKAGEGEGEGVLLLWRCLSSQTTTTCIEALLPGT